MRKHFILYEVANYSLRRWEYNDVFINSLHITPQSKGKISVVFRNCCVCNFFLHNTDYQFNLPKEIFGFKTYTKIHPPEGYTYWGSDPKTNGVVVYSYIQKGCPSFRLNFSFFEKKKVELTI